MDFRKIAAASIAFVVLAGCAGSAAAQDEETEIAVGDLQDAEAVCQKHRAELMKIPHVRVVTAEIDPRKEAVILIEVDDPENVDSVMRRVPSKLEGFSVEVDEGQGDDDDDSGPAINSVTVGHWGNAAPTPIPPTIDKQGYYHHAWLKPSEPTTNSNAQP